MAEGNARKTMVRDLSCDRVAGRGLGAREIGALEASAQECSCRNTVEKQKTGSSKLLVLKKRF